MNDRPAVADIPNNDDGLTVQERLEELDREVRLLVQQGFRVESQSTFQAVMVKGKRPNHILHLILTLLTFGLWGIVWICVAVFGGEQRIVVGVDELGDLEKGLGL